MFGRIVDDFLKSRKDDKKTETSKKPIDKKEKPI